MSPSVAATARSGPPIGFREFVCLMAALIACNALGIDAMLPALPEMGRALGITQENQQQWVISAYMFGFAVSNLFCGPLGDRYGRRPVVLAGLLLYALMSILAAFSTNLAMMVGARMLQGMAAAAGRVLAVAMVRDCFSGRQMAQVMSLTFIVFLMVPMLAPSLGQIILMVGPWQGIFGLLALFSLAVALWLVLRMSETLPVHLRRSLAPRDLAQAAARVLSDRASLGYALATAATFGAQVGFVTSSQQLFAEVFGTTRLFPLLFASIAAGLAAASFVNSRIVLRQGTRRVSHTALLAYILLGGLHLLILVWIGETLASFAMFMSLAMFFTGLMSANFNAMAMENMGDIAGMASSIQGSLATLSGLIIGVIVGQTFNGTAMPVVLSYFLCGLAALAATLYAEQGRLFRPQYAAPL